MQRFAKITLVPTSLLTGLALTAIPAFAHVVVTPNQVGVAKFQTFDIGVPTEKDNPTVSVRLVVPDGLKAVTPNVKPGWTIAEKKTGSGETAVVTEITWSGGSIPTDQRDDFLFSAQVPSKASTLKWKAYQTYKDGSVVSWDADPATIKKGEEGTPYSTTTVVDDLSGLKTSTTDDRSMLQRFLDDSTTPLVASGAAVVLSLAALTFSLARRKSSQI